MLLELSRSPEFSWERLGAERLGRGSLEALHQDLGFQLPKQAKKAETHGSPQKRTKCECSQKWTLTGLPT